MLDGLDLTRGLVTEPANIVYPETFVERARAALDGLGVEFEVLDEKAMAKLGMGALLGVGQGSVRPPRLLAMRWNGGKAGREAGRVRRQGHHLRHRRHLDQAGAGMEAMKWDMGGAGAVAGADEGGRRPARRRPMSSASARSPRICPTAMPSAPATSSPPCPGQTIEVINTDAEGRLVLADAMTWAQRQYKPEVMIDLATLTGAMIISLGHEYGGMFSNDDGLAGKLDAAGKASGDKLWRLPMGDAYDKIMDSQIADMRNSASREGGSITAACFLGRFVEEGVKWAHLDIAGMVWSEKPSHLYDKGATGYGVALLDRYLAGESRRLDPRQPDIRAVRLWRLPAGVRSREPPNPILHPRSFIGPWPPNALFRSSSPTPPGAT